MAKKEKPVGADGHRGRMFKKLIVAGDSEITSRDILEMLLYFPIRVRDTRDSAVELMEKYRGDFYKVLSAPENELVAVSGIGPSAAKFLNLVGEIVKRAEAAEKAESAPTSLARRISVLFDGLRGGIVGDELWAVFVNSQSEITGAVKVREDFGIPAEKEAYMILQKSLRCHAPFLVLAHVTGGLEIYPSVKDNRLFRSMKSTFGFTNLSLIAYYMIGGDEIMPIPYSATKLPDEG